MIIKDPVITVNRQHKFINLIIVGIYLSLSILMTKDAVLSQLSKAEQLEPNIDTSGQKFSLAIVMVIKLGKKYGYTDCQGKSIFTPRFDYAEQVVDGLALVKQAGKLGYIKF